MRWIRKHYGINPELIQGVRFLRAEEADKFNHHKILRLASDEVNHSMRICIDRRQRPPDSRWNTEMLIRPLTWFRAKVKSHHCSIVQTGPSLSHSLPFPLPVPTYTCRDVCTSISVIHAGVHGNPQRDFQAHIYLWPTICKQDRKIRFGVIYYSLTLDLCAAAPVGGPASQSSGQLSIRHQYQHHEVNEAVQRGGWRIQRATGYDEAAPPNRK